MTADSPFWNRTQELSQIRRWTRAGALGYVTGRRRVGKTALLVKACREFGGLYHQAVEGTAEQQLLHLVEEWRPALPVLRDVMPRTWVEFFRLLMRDKLPPLMVFDEFPYWVQGDQTLPSVLQKWVDHELPKAKTLLLVSGSSQSMLHTQFLGRDQPLFGRAQLHLDLEPLSFEWFCRALGYDLGDPLSFSRFSLVGGVPHYWKLMSKGSWLSQAEELFYAPSAILSLEPGAWLRDEGMVGSLPKALLDLIGRGVSKPSEMAARLHVPQGNLSRPLGVLLDLGWVRKELPFGESSRSTKKVLYSIEDPALRFYYSTYLPTRHRWMALSDKEKSLWLNQHVSQQWEIFCRGRFPGSGRYWEGTTELDLVMILPGEGRGLVAECKWADLSPSERSALLEDLRHRFARTRLAGRLKQVTFDVFSKSDLKRLTTLRAERASIQ